MVVDNGSNDGTAELVRAAFPRVDLLEAGTNLGFAAATNVGIRRGTGEFVLVLNPDTELRPGALERLLAVFEQQPRVAVVGPRLVRPDGSFDHAARRSFPTPLGALAHFVGIGRRVSSGRLAQYRAPHVERGPVDAVNGAFMLIRRLALDDVGLFDEGYWMYMEDLDLCYRLAQRGWTTWYEPDATVLHVKHGTSGERRSPRLVYAFHYGMWRYYRAHLARTRPPLLNAAVYAAIGVKLLVALAPSAAAAAVAAVRMPPRGAPDA